jgi:hypothetical protein
MVNQPIWNYDRGMKIKLILLCYALWTILPYPVHYTPDSAFYIHAANTIGSGMLNREHDNPRLQASYPSGAPYTQWTPLYPVLLSIGQRGLPIEWVYRGINALALMGIFIILAWQPIHWSLRVGAIVFAGQVLQPAAISAMPDLLLFFLFLLFADAVERRRDWAYLILIAMAASLTKYAGVLLIGSGTVYLLYQKQWRLALLFTLLSALPLALWMTRNMLLTDTWAGTRTAATIPWHVTLRHAAWAIGGWIALLILYTGVPYVLWSHVRRVSRRHAARRVYYRDERAVGAG